MLDYVGLCPITDVNLAVNGASWFIWGKWDIFLGTFACVYGVYCCGKN